MMNRDTTVRSRPRSGWIEANGVSLRYRLEGIAAPIILLIHEAGGMIESWDAVASQLAPAACVVRYDMRGAGLSEKIVGAVTLDEMADDAMALLDRLGLARPVVACGIAIGGAVALRCATRHAERVDRLILIGPARTMAADKVAGALALADRIEREGARARPRDVDRLFPRELRTDPDLFESWRARAFVGDSRSGAALRRMMALMDTESDIDAVCVATLVIAGELDPARPVDTAAALAARIPGAQLMVLRTGHFAHVQTPMLIADAIATFLS